jgi:hypothetical protein
MKIRIWLATRDRWTWIAAAETLGLALVLTMAVDSVLARLLGFGLLAHLGYSALTGLPMGEIPGRPQGGQPRRNLDLRGQVVWFLREVRRVDEYAQRIQVAGLPGDEVEASRRAGEQRIMVAAARVAKATSRSTSQETGLASPA